KRSQWLNEECVVLDRRGMILHATERALAALQNHRHGTDDDAATRFLKTLPFDQWPVKLKELLPNASFDLVENETSGIGAIVILHTRRASPVRDIRKSKPAFERRDAANSSHPRKHLASGPQPIEESVGDTTSNFVAR